MNKESREKLRALIKDRKFAKSLKEISMDRRFTGNEYLTKILDKAIDFDYLMREYCKLLKEPGPSSPPTSCDALIVKDDGRYILIEFKNGKIQSIKRDVKRKMSDSMLCLLDILGESVAFAREHFEFILVYNESRNRKEKLERTDHLDKKKYRSRRKLGKKEIQHSEFFTVFSNSVAEHAKVELILPGFGLYQGLWWKAVHTYNNRKFEYEYRKGL
jgi:hypothetical protein